MKRFLFFITLLYVNSIFAYDYYVGGIYYNLNVSEMTAEVTNKTGSFNAQSYSMSVAIPPSIAYGSEIYSVVSIGDYAFDGCSKLTSITIPNSVTTIGEWAFHGCSGLTSVTIPNSVTEIGREAFSGCNDLTSVIISNSVTSIEDYAFDGCSKLTSITIPNSVTTIGEWAFNGCSGLTSVTIPNSVTEIGDYAFDGCSGLTSAIIGNSVATIGEAAFRNCSGLTSVTIPNSITTIGGTAFSGCSDLISIDVNAANTHYCSIDGVLFNYARDTLIQYPIGNTRTKYTIPNSVTTIGEWAFGRCSIFTSVTIPNSVTTIGESAFYSCSKLSSIVIPNSVTTIGYDAFSGCKNLTSITIPNSVTTIGESAFNGCSGLTSPLYNATIFAFMPQSYKGAYTIPDGIKQIIGNAFNGCKGLTSITIPSSVTTIGGYAFSGCSGLTSITIPNSVTTIDDYAFYGCTSLPIIENLRYADTYLVGVVNKTFSTYTIKEGTKWVGSSAFWNCTSLKSIEIPNSATTIGNDAFYGCSGLTSVTIPNSVAKIERDAFFGCNGLTSITIPNSVTSIGYDAFYGCSGLTSVTIPNSVTSIGANAFYGCSSLNLITSYAITPPNCGRDCFYEVNKSIPIYVHARYVNDYKQASEWKNFKNIKGFRDEYATVTCITHNGTVSGAGKYIKGDTCILTVTANYGYHFTQWSDGNIDNPRTIQVLSDTTFTAIFAKNIYTISVEAEHGSVTGDGDYEYLSNVQLTATADEHYHFARWSDEVTDNPRQIIVKGDKTYTAIFSIDQHTISAYAEHGVVSGTGSHDYGTEATLTVIPNIGYDFATWSDGNTDNPRTVLVTEDATYNSTCTLATKGTCGDNLYWEYKDGSLIINGQGAMYNFAFDQVPWILYRDSIQQVELCEGLTNVGNNAFASCSKLTSVNIPNTVTTIGESAFESCTYLKTITLGKSLTDIGCNAFKGDFRIEEITSYAEVTPNVCSSTFDGLSKQYIYLYVPENSIRSYQVDPNWNGFDIRTKAADKKPIDGENPIVTPSDQDVTITWPITDGTDTYTLTISKNGETVCVLTFNANGQLTNIAFAAPGHNGAHQAPAATLTAQGYQFTVTGLNPGTAYNYSVTATDARGKTLAEHKGNFSTTGGESSLESVHGSQPTPKGLIHKVIRNGQLLIETNNATYTPMGQKVK